MKNPRSLLLPVFGGLAALLALALILMTITRSGTPGDLSPEAGFSRDMAIHHAQAVEMSFAVRDASSDQQVRQLAYDIIVTQTAQRGIFMGWLQQWKLDQSSSQPVMAWMTGHGHEAPAAGQGAATMPGMASEAEFQQLTAAKGTASEALFLQLMIRHHEGGVQMAQGVLKLTSREEVRSMAQHIVDGQQAEIATMKQLLTKRGAQPLPSILK